MDKKIFLHNKEFLVEDKGIAKNYSNVSNMFDFMDNLKIDKDAVIFDVGANIGIYSMSYAILFQSARIYSFEPVPDTYTSLEKNIRKNPLLLPRITPFNFGLSNSNIELELSIPSKLQHERYDLNNNINSGLFSVHGKGEDKVIGSFKTLDSFFKEELNIKKIDVIKIDVEGHEFEVLEGAKDTITQNKPIIIMEFNELTRTLSHHDFDDFEDFFKNQGYLLYGLEYGWKKDLTLITDLSQTENISDVIAVFDTANV